MKLVRDVVEILLAMSGIVVRRLQVMTVLALGVSFAVYYLVLVPQANLTWAVWYFVWATVVHYMLLFGVFARTDNNWAKRLINRYGEERGYALYETWMGFVFCHNGLSTGYICAASPVGLEFVPAAVLPAVGIACSLIGLPIKVWATRVVGIDTYYYKDLFLRRPVSEFKVEGPYRFLNNPMYGVGHLHGYGVALLSGSLAGIVAVAFNQLCIWTFYFLVEKPHIHEMYGSGAPEPEAAQHNIVS
jgi:protein-S-isoprenylcysteine O-methyltransferase Ste14